MTTDAQLVRHLKNFCRFSHVMEDDRCVEISFHAEHETLGGTLRRHPHKNEIARVAASLPHLRHLSFRKCKLGTIPEPASKDLEHLDLGSNALTEVPAWITDLPKLKYLSLGANALKDVPDLDHLPLETLKLHKNEITRLPKVGAGLKSLNLYLNPFPAFPEAVSGLTGLEVFTFGVNDTRELPPLTPFKALRWLTVTVTELEALPDDLCTLKALEGLVVAKNRLRGLPERIGELTALRHLTVYGNEITELPTSFFNLSLKRLNVAENPLEHKEWVRQVFHDAEFLRV